MNESIDQLRMDAHAQLTLLRRAIERISSDDDELSVLDSMLEKVKSHPYSVAVVGEFNRGKSSLINALLGMPVLPADVTPTTATINRVVYADAPCAKLCLHDGNEEILPIQMLKARVTKLSEEAASAAKQVREAVIGYPTVFCRGNISILDTPGLNESEAMDELTLSYARNVDAVIFLVSALAPYSTSEAEAVCQLLTNTNIRHILFTVSFIDRVQDVPGNEEKIISTIQKRIIKYTLPIIEANTDLSPEEKERQKKLLLNAAVLGVSAKKALDAFVSGSMEDLHLSRIEAYKTELMSRLTAQQNEWLSAEVLPYLKRTASVFGDAVQRKVRMLENRIQEAENKISNCKKLLSSLSADQAAIVDAWACQVQDELGTKDTLEAPIRSIIQAKAEEVQNSLGQTTETPLSDIFHSGINAGIGSGMLHWLKKKANDAGIYRDSSDASLQQMRSGFEQARDMVIDQWLPMLQLSASELYRSAYNHCNALCNDITTSLLQAAAVLNKEVAIPQLDNAVQADVQLLDSAAVAEIRALTFPLWANVDTIEHVIPRLATYLAGKYSEKVRSGITRISKTQFPESTSFCIKQYEDAVTLDTACAALKQTLIDMKAEALSIQRLLGNEPEGPQESAATDAAE